MDKVYIKVYMLQWSGDGTLVDWAYLDKAKAEEKAKTENSKIGKINKLINSILGTKVGWQVKEITVYK